MKLHVRCLPAAIFRSFDFGRNLAGWLDFAFIISAMFQNRARSAAFIFCPRLCTLFIFLTALVTAPNYVSASEIQLDKDVYEIGATITVRLTEPVEPQMRRQYLAFVGVFELGSEKGRKTYGDGSIGAVEFLDDEKPLPEELHFKAPKIPGKFSIQYYRNSRSYDYGKNLIDLLEFDVRATKEPGAITLDQAVYRPNQKATAYLKVMGDRYLESIISLAISRFDPANGEIWTSPMQHIDISTQPLRPEVFIVPEQEGCYRVEFFDRQASGGFFHAIDEATFSVSRDISTSLCPDLQTLRPDYATASSVDPLTGETTTTTRNLDGSRTIVRADEGGRVIAIETQGPPGSGATSKSFVDRESGLVRTVIRDGDGQRRILESIGWIDALGDTNLLQTDSFGREIELVTLANGITVIQARDILGRADETIILQDGTRLASRRTPLGDLIQTVETPDGQVEIAVFDSAEQPVAQIRRNNDGSATTINANGQLRTVSAPNRDGTMEIVAEDAQGNTISVIYDSEGEIVATTQTRTKSYEPGEAYYLNDLNGNIPWQELDAGDKKQFADTEQLMRNNRDTARFRDAQTEARRLEKDLQRERFAELDAMLDTELAAIAAAQTEADRVALARSTQLELDAERNEVAEKLSDLDRRIKISRDSGNVEEQRKLEAEHDELHDATLDLFLPTIAESAEIKRKQKVRDTLLDEVGGVARDLGDKAYQIIADRQDATETFASGARYVSLGAEMQNVLAKNQRVAMREQAGALGWFEAIENKLADPETTIEEREILTDMADLARLRQEGGSRLMNENSRIIMAGYTTDVVLAGLGTVSKATLQGGKKLASKVIVDRAASAAFAEQIAAGATRESAIRVARTAGQSALTAAESQVGSLQSKIAKTRVAEVSGQILTTELQISKRLAEHKILESMVVDAVVGAGADAAIQLNETGSVDLAETMRGAVAGSMMAGLSTTGKTANRAIWSGRWAADSANSSGVANSVETPTNSGATTIEDPYAGGPDIFVDTDDLLPGPSEPQIGARSRHLGDSEIRRLYQPGRNLSAEEIQVKADLHRDLEQRRRKLDLALQEDRPPDEVRGLIRDLIAQRDRIPTRPMQSSAQAAEIHQHAAGDTQVLSETPIHAWPDEATLIIDADGRPILRDGKLVTTETPVLQQAPGDTLILPEPPTHARPDEATMIIDADGRPIVRNGELVTPETPAQQQQSSSDFSKTDPTPVLPASEKTGAVEGNIRVAKPLEPQRPERMTDLDQMQANVDQKKDTQLDSLELLPGDLEEFANKTVVQAPSQQFDAEVQRDGRYRHLETEMTIEGKETDRTNDIRILPLRELDRHRVIADSKGKLVFASNGEVLNTPGTSKAIFVMDVHGNIFVHMQPDLPGIKHSSLAAGQKPAAAGGMYIRNGELIFVDNGSGHYGSNLNDLSGWMTIAELRRKGAVFGPVKPTDVMN